MFKFIQQQQHQGRQPVTKTFNLSRTNFHIFFFFFFCFVLFCIRLCWAIIIYMLCDCDVDSRKMFPANNWIWYTDWLWIRIRIRILKIELVFMLYWNNKKVCMCGVGRIPRNSQAIKMCFVVLSMPNQSPFEFPNMVCSHALSHDYQLTV